MDTPAARPAPAYAPVNSAANATSCWVIIPVKAPGEGKTRLAAVLGPEAREGLIQAMLERVVAAAFACSSVQRVFVVTSHDRQIAGTETIAADHGTGLNGTLRSAMALLPPPPPHRIIVVSADLPCITSADLEALAKLPANEVAVAPDHQGQGTNAISMPASSAPVFRFAFGSGSHARHLAEASRLGLDSGSLVRGGLQRDIDEPGDLRLLPAAFTALLPR